MTVTQQPCPQCRGSGMVQRLAGNQPVNLRCQHCRGSGTVQVQVPDDGVSVTEFLSRFGGTPRRADASRNLKGKRREHHEQP